MRVFLLSGDFKGDRIYTLKSKEKQYLGKVLRLEVGTVFTAKDRKENYYRAELIDEGTLSLELSENYEETLLDGLSGHKYCGNPSCICIEHSNPGNSAV